MPLPPPPPPEVHEEPPLWDVTIYVGSGGGDGRLYRGATFAVADLGGLACIILVQEGLETVYPIQGYVMWWTLEKHEDRL